MVALTAEDSGEIRVYGDVSQATKDALSGAGLGTCAFPERVLGLSVPLPARSNDPAQLV